MTTTSASTAAPANVVLDQPLYGATIGQAFVRFWRKCVTLHGRASRSEFWWWFLIYAGGGVLLSILNQAVVGAAPTGQTSLSEIIDHTVKVSIASTAWSLINFVGAVTLTVRRLHDTNRSGWWWFIQLVPVIGSIIMIIFVALPTHPAGSRFDR
ncbi:DUF805 domain-containing protein [Microlunatus elymi]|uniref:DUF805 domain-containing protein n=1 Tax=Microlunatus elymi TaxID=2596828 RepID=A0A516Q230_9ACTN|nr:DUF805 domain-containing protein [Microlunatus elymi]QDP97271.1 DUF805 domain-containing protein [Microlunatus elymi]